MKTSDDLTGKQFSDLVVIKNTGKCDKWDGPILVCKCKCGNIKEIPARRLIKNHTKSCGCLKCLTGKRFGRLQVIAMTDKYDKNNRIYKCRCDCGNTIEVSSNYLGSGHTKSCGCLYKDSRQFVHKTHGGYKERLYSIWTGMKYRCIRKKHANYKNYGARGITVCNEWMNSYEAFRDWAMKNGYREDLTIERKNVNGNYEPDNCCWITKTEQAKNKRNNVIIGGKILADWVRERCVSIRMVTYRIDIGWTEDKLLSFLHSQPLR